MPKKLKSIHFLFPCAVLLFALACFALSAHASVQEIILKDIPEDPRNLCAFLQLIVNIKNLALMIGAPITVLFIIIGGVNLSVAGSSSPVVERAKKMITGGIIGLVIVLCAWLIVGGVITALFGRDVGPAWWTIQGCSAVDTGTGGSNNGGDNDGNGDGDTPSGDPSKATSDSTCRDACAPLSHAWDGTTCTCHGGSNDPGTATSEDSCRAACLPKRYNWNTNANPRCTCSSQGSLTIDPGAEFGRLGPGGQEFLTCLESFYLLPEIANIWRVGDPNGDCYDENKWDATACIFEKYSCHYGGHYCRGQSYSIDFNNVSDKTLFMAAVISCGGAPPSDKGSYIHVRFTSGCRCTDDI